MSIPPIPNVLITHSIRPAFCQRYHRWVLTESTVPLHCEHLITEIPNRKVITPLLQPGTTLLDSNMVHISEVGLEALWVAFQGVGGGMSNDTNPSILPVL